MLYLLISIAFMAATAMIFRRASDRGVSAMGFNAVFRLVAGAVGLVSLAGTSPAGDSLSAGMWTAMAIGACCYWLTGLATIQSVQRGHLGVTWTVTRCATALPTVASLLWWGELAAMRRDGLGSAVTGLVAIFVAIVLLGIDRAQAHRNGSSRAITLGWCAWLAVAFIAQGGWEISLRAAGSLAGNAERMLFMQGVFIGSGLLSAASIPMMRLRLGRREWGYGILAAVVVMIASGVRPWAIAELGGVIVFPVTAASVMVLVQLASSLLWSEKLSRWGLLGMAAAIAGVVLLNG